MDDKSFIFENVGQESVTNIQADNSFIQSEQHSAYIDGIEPHYGEKFRKHHSKIINMQNGARDLQKFEQKITDLESEQKKLNQLIIQHREEITQNMQEMTNQVSLVVSTDIRKAHFKDFIASESVR